MAIAERLRIVVSGMIAGDPYQGGAAWAVLQYVLGFQSLGHDVCLIEPIAAESMRPASAALADSINATYFSAVTARFNLAGRAALLQRGTRETAGLRYASLLDFAGSSDVLINVSGMLTDEALIERIPCRVYLDLDPAFNQLWHSIDGVDMRFDRHTHFVTVGRLIGTPTCAIPTCGRTWISTCQPIVLPEWPAAPPRPDGAWTTVANWRGYGSINHDGVMFGQKAHSFRRFMNLPQRTRELLRPALAIHHGEVNDIAALRDNGWSFVDAASTVDTPDRYRRFIRGSKGELGIAKSGYVASRCGWFSDRSVCYLATGRPVIAQDTGFAQWLPTGQGLLAFDTVDGAAAALDDVAASYDAHCLTARSLAETHFRSDHVLNALLDRVGASDDLRTAREFMAVDAAVDAPGSPGASAR